MKNKHILLALTAFFVMLPISNLKAQEQPQEASPDLTAVKDFMKQFGIADDDGQIESSVQSFLTKCTTDLKNILDGGSPMISTPEGLMSISSLVAALMMKSSMLKIGLAGLGAAGAYHTMTTARNPTPSDIHPSVDDINQDEATISVEATPAHPEKQTSGFFNTVVRDNR